VSLCYGILTTLLYSHPINYHNDTDEKLSDSECPCGCLEFDTNLCDALKCIYKLIHNSIMKIDVRLVVWALFIL